MKLPEIIPLSTIQRWLPEIFPEGTPSRNFIIREMSARSIFVFIYVGAVEGFERWVRPDQITKMTNSQAATMDEENRERWYHDSLKPGAFPDGSGRWYAANTREPIRDETLRLGLILVGAVSERRDLATTSSKPRYALAQEFYELLARLEAKDANASELIKTWQAKNLSASARARVALVRKGITSSGAKERVQISFPNGEVRFMRPGPSTSITKHVIEQFAPVFLKDPAIIFLTESGDKVLARDDELARELGLNLEYGKLLPDIVMADLAPQSAKLVLCEVVATDGAITENRKKSLLEALTSSGRPHSEICFLTAFSDRARPEFRRLSAEIAWGTFVWFASEPDKLLAFLEQGPSEFSRLSLGN